MNYEEFFNMLEDEGHDLHLKDGAKPEDIEKFEKENGVILPTQFKEWLMFADGGSLFLPGGPFFRSVSQKPFIDVNEPDRPNDNYVVIGFLSYGDPIMFEKGTQKIMIYDHEAGVIHDDEVYEDFNSFLKDYKNLFGID